MCFFRFFLLPCLPQGCHRGLYGQTTKKPRFTKCGFFVFSSFLASHIGDIEARMGKPRKNHVLQSVVFSFFPPSLSPTGVTQRSVWANHEKTTFYKVWFFRFFLFPCLPQGCHRGLYGQTMKKTTFHRVCFFRFFLLPCPHGNAHSKKISKHGKSTSGTISRTTKFMP